MNLIYCVEDDESIRELILYALNSGGYEAVGFGCAEDFFKGVSKKLPNLVLLDIMLPGEDGVAILRKLRNQPATSKTSIIMLTAKSSEFDKVKCLEMGADDYISKPFGVMELLARIKAALRRSAPIFEALTYGEIVLNQETRTVLAKGQPCVLTFKEFELLHYLLLNEGLVMSREKIMSAVWECDFEMESRTVDMHIKSLRQKLEACGVVGYIKTVRSVGYMLSCQG